MDVTEDFYVTLSSNSCLNFHPDNKSNSFKVLLRKELALNDFKVALTEIIFSPIFGNVLENNNTIYFGFTSKDNANNKSVTMLKCRIPIGNYKSVKDLMDKINSCVRDKKFDWMEKGTEFLEFVEGKVLITSKFKNNLTTFSIKNLTISNVSREMEIRFENNLAKMLGYTPNANVFELKPEYPFVEYSPVEEIFIYSNVVDYQLVSNFAAPLLRVFATPAPPAGGKKVCIEFANRNYLQTCNNNLRYIEVECKDALGNLVPFARDSNMILTLHFIKS